MSEWVEHGPFRVRVAELAKEHGFRESGAPDRVLEVAWTREQPRRSSGVVSLVLLVIVVWLLSGVPSLAPELVPWVSVILIGAGVALIVELYTAVRRSRRTRDREARVTLDGHDLSFWQGDHTRAFPRARVELETEIVDGLHQAVLVTGGERLVIFESRHELEVDWLVQKLKTSLAGT